jgi:hypothetical protein
MFMVYIMFFYVLKELRHLLNDIKLDTVLTINKTLTKLAALWPRERFEYFHLEHFVYP